MKALDRKAALAAHRYQFDGSHRNPNECALCAMTTLLQLAAARSGQSLDLAAVDLGRFLDRIPFRHPRFPAWFPGPGGATHPRAAWKGLNAYLRRLRKEDRDLPWMAVLRTRQRQDDLAAALEAGELVMIYGVGHTGIPHVVVPVERTDDGWLILDPATPTPQNPLTWSDEQLGEWWVNYGWIYPAGTLVSLIPAS